MRVIHRWPVNSPHKWPVTRKMFPFDDIIMRCVKWRWVSVYHMATAPCPKSWWRHQMETFSMLLALCAGISPITGELPSQRPKRQWRGTLIFSLICAWTNVWVNNRYTGDLRRHLAHYDVTVMVASYLNKCRESVQNYAPVTQDLS